MYLHDCIVIAVIYLQLFLIGFLQSLFKSVCFGLKRLVLEGEGVYLVLEDRHTNEHTNHVITSLTFIQVNLHCETPRGYEQGLETPARWYFLCKTLEHTRGAFGKPLTQGIQKFLPHLQLADTGWH